MRSISAICIKANNTSTSSTLSIIVNVHTCGFELIGFECSIIPVVLQSATLTKGVVKGKRTSTHSFHLWVAANSIGTLPVC